MPKSSKWSKTGLFPVCLVCIWSEYVVYCPINEIPWRLTPWDYFLLVLPHTPEQFALNKCPIYNHPKGRATFVMDILRGVFDDRAIFIDQLWVGKFADIKNTISAHRKTPETDGV